MGKGECGKSRGGGIGQRGGAGEDEQTCVQEAPGEKSPVVRRHDHNYYRTFTALGLVYGGGPSQLHIIQLCPFVCNLPLCTTRGPL